MNVMLKFKVISCIMFGVLLNNIAIANFNATIPVIDMNDYYSDAKRQIFIRNLANAMQTVGFVAVINSRVNKLTLDAAYLSAENFYKKPVFEKLQYHNPALNGQRGYVQSEVAKGQKKKDFKEFYHISREYPKAISQQYHYVDNIWPKDVQFRADMQKLMSELDVYTMVIAEALAESIGKEKDFFTKLTVNGDCLLRSIHYPANPPIDTVWASAHTDIDLFTILPRATAQGLQVLNKDNEWVDVVVPENAFIINAGDMLQNITNGVYKSAAHRVVSKNSNVERYSMVLFIHPRPNDRLDPLPEFIKKVGKQNYANVTRNELLFERLIDLGLHSPELLQIFAESGAMDKLVAVNRGSLAAMQALRDANLATPAVLAALEKHAEN